MVSEPAKTTLPAKTTTLIEFECVMSFSKMQLSTIKNMNDNIIIKGRGLRTGLKARINLSFFCFRTEVRIDSSSFWDILYPKSTGASVNECSANGIIRCTKTGPRSE